LPGLEGACDGLWSWRVNVSWGDAETEKTLSMIRKLGLKIDVVRSRGVYAEKVINMVIREGYGGDKDIWLLWH
jgi:hypothetical protein